MSVTLFFIGLSLGIFSFLLLILNKNKESLLSYIKPFILLVFFATIYEFISYFPNWQTPIWSRIYILLEFLCIFYYYYLTLKKRFAFFFKLSLVLFLLFYVYLIVVWDAKDSYLTDFYLTTFETIFVLISSILWFVIIFDELKEASLLKVPDYYFISGFVLYFSGTFFLFLISDFMLKNMTSQFLSYWNLNILFTILLRTLLITGIWIARKK